MLDQGEFLIAEPVFFHCSSSDRHIGASNKIFHIDSITAFHFSQCRIRVPAGKNVRRETGASACFFRRKRL
jgi:hypothetical protein